MVRILERILTKTEINFYPFFFKYLLTVMTINQNCFFEDTHSSLGDFL